MIIKTHKDLADQIAGKSILHLNSGGKDSVLCLEWLAKFAHPAKIVSVNFKFFAPHPDDDRYFEYLKKRYPQVHFVTEPNVWDINRVITGQYQSPVDVINYIQNLDYEQFDIDKFVTELKIEHGCDYICKGHSRSESFRRAVEFHKKGILVNDEIFPIGMFSKKQIIDLIKSQNIKLHPCYKLNGATLDKPSYFKYRSAFFAKPLYEKKMMEVYPLLALDAYRWQVLFNKG